MTTKISSLSFLIDNIQALETPRAYAPVLNCLQKIYPMKNREVLLRRTKADSGGIHIPC